MSGTLEGGQAAAKTNVRKYGEDYYKKIGAMGGRNGKTGGFWHHKHILGDDNFARIAGAKGGKISHRKKK